VTKGSEVSLYYDPLIAKVIAWGKDRAEAISRMSRALAEFKIAGVATTIGFHSQVMSSPRFQKGELTTHFIADEFTTDKKEKRVSNQELELVALSSALIEYRESRKGFKSAYQNGSAKSNWKIQARQSALRNFVK
jgi:acetyl/propionyl-CoA carboxylase alpha subunit